MPIASVTVGPKLNLLERFIGLLCCFVEDDDLNRKGGYEVGADEEGRVGALGIMRRGVVVESVG